MHPVLKGAATEKSDSFLLLFPTDLTKVLCAADLWANSLAVKKLSAEACSRSAHLLMLQTISSVWIIS